MQRVGNEKIIIEVGGEIGSRTEVADVGSSLLSGGGGRHGHRLECCCFCFCLLFGWWIFGWWRYLKEMSSLKSLPAIFVSFSRHVVAAAARSRPARPGSKVEVRSTP